ncbi:penicillin-binding transpeptidase domain-containing protein, partial [Lactobacillus nasalidis]
MSYFRKNSGTGNGSQTANTPLRMKILVGIIVILFAALIGQLAYLQLFYGSRFSAEVNATDQTTVTKAVPRGVMYDSQGRILVGNKAENAITYTRSLSATSKEMYQVANILSNYIKITDEKPTKRQIADYYLADSNRAKKVLSALPKSQKKSSLTTSEINEYEVAYVENTIKPTLSTKQKTAALLYNKMSGASTLSTINLKSSGLSNKEIAQVGEHLSSMPGVGIGTDWNRYYPNGSSIKSIIGSVSTTKTGLPSDNLQYYLVNGYSRNDRVGTSYLEKEYEALLKGTKASYKVTSNTSSNTVTKTKQVYKGQSGASLKLTIDAKYQAEVTKALKQQFNSALSAGAASLSSGAYAVAMNPQTGAVLAMAGISYDPSTKKVSDNALGNINQSFVMGSVVKGAQVAGGLINKVITPTNNTLPDTAIYLPGTSVKKSVYPVGTFSSLTAASALEVSSNIYMMQLTLRWVKASYVAKKYIHMPQTAFQTLRNNFKMFGLGQKTGIDLPGESSGIEGSSTDSSGNILAGSVLDESYGNYDAYTPIQLVQYVSTIANGGYRMQPYVVQSIGR